MNDILVSTGTIPLATKDNFSDYYVIESICSQLDIDGVEFVILPEWDQDNRPLTPTSAKWSESIKPSHDELLSYIKNTKLNPKVIHCNRDIGNYLCSNKEDMVTKGLRILDENLLFAKEIHANVAVLHLWDTYSNKIDIEKLFNMVFSVGKKYDFSLAIENIPISDKSLSQKAIWEMLESIMPPNYGFTLDLNWCSLYNNFNELILYHKRILNVHVQGNISASGLRPRVGDLNLMDCLKTILLHGYQGYITLELCNPKEVKDFVEAIKLIKNEVSKCIK